MNLGPFARSMIFTKNFLKSKYFDQQEALQVKSFLGQYGQIDDDPKSFATLE